MDVTASVMDGEGRAFQPQILYLLDPESGRPNSLLRLPTERKTVNFFPRTEAIISFVVVLPALPVTPIMVIPQRRRTSRARACRASSVDLTRIVWPDESFRSSSMTAAAA